MTTVYIADRFQSLDSFIVERCADIPPEEQPALCENIARYNNYSSPGGLISRDQLVFMPDNPHQFVCRGLPMAHQLTPGLNYEQRRTLGELLRHNTGEEILAMAEIRDQMPADNDAFKAFAGASLGAAKSRGDELNKAIRRYNDALVKWKNTPHHQDRQRVNMRHVKPAFDDLHRTFEGESRPQTS